MNERIKELAEAAGYEIRPLYKSTEDYRIPHYNDEKLEKFAELLLKEVGKICEDRPAWTGRMIGNQIQEHFDIDPRLKWCWDCGEGVTDFCRAPGEGKNNCKLFGVK
jgi:hypothetical protein